MEYRFKDFGICEDPNMCTTLIKLQLTDGDQKEDFEKDMHNRYGDVEIKHYGERTEVFFNIKHYDCVLDFYQRLLRLHYKAKPFGIVL